MAINVTNLMAIFLGGGLGSVLRTLISLLVVQLSLKFWVSTLFVNVVGALLYSLAVKHLPGRFETWHLLVRLGFLGGLTTFSTLSFELISLLKEKSFVEAFGVLGLNVFFGIIVVYLIFR